MCGATWRSCGHELHVEHLLNKIFKQDDDLILSYARFTSYCTSVACMLTVPLLRDCRRAPRFSGYQQQDSHELLRYLLDNLRTEETKVRITCLMTACPDL
jgi:uncharacterized UBP type Zn finger protein